MVSPRWVGSGWTIFNNKGKPVRQYEPFFSATHRFEFGVTVGVSPVLFYDPVERVVATLHPNHTWEKVVFDPWQQNTWDVNDTWRCNRTDRRPATDPDVGGFFAAYFKTQPRYLATWHAQRIGGALGRARTGRGHRAPPPTPTRPPPRTSTRWAGPSSPSRTTASSAPATTSTAPKTTSPPASNWTSKATSAPCATPIQQAGDPLGRIVMRYAYDMLGNRIHQLSMEAGARWMLNDVAGKPIRAWDSRGHNFTTSYDALRRPVGADRARHHARTPIRAR